MIFGEVPLAQAEGAILAHSVSVPSGKLRKGITLTAQDLDQLAAAGRTQVTVARLSEDDLQEDAAATEIAQALMGTGLRASVAATGRVNLFAKTPGIASIDRQGIDQFNAVNPMITVATVPPHHRLDAGTMLATIKIISYGVPQRDVARASDIGRDALGVRLAQFRTATLIETVTDDPPSAKGRAAMQGRLDRFDIALTPRTLVPHAIGPLTDALTQAEGDVIFILTASATSDPNDVGPAAVWNAGGQVTQFGMPVDPGNLLFFGVLGDRPVIGLPGCARSPALNGADWVLERVICGVPPSPQDFAAMGVGGLLKEIPTRPRPRDS